MRQKIEEIFPEINWIDDNSLREKVIDVFADGFAQGNLTPEDITHIPYTATYEAHITYQKHVRLVTSLSVSAYDNYRMVIADTSHELNRDYLIAGAILHDVGKLLELDLDENRNLIKSHNGKLVRHAFSGVFLAMKHQLPDEITHIIAVHSHEGVASKRTVLAEIVKLSDQTAEAFSSLDIQE